MRMRDFWPRVAGLQDKEWRGQVDPQGQISLFHPTLKLLTIKEICSTFHLQSKDSRRVVEAAKNIGQRHKKTRRKLCRALGLPIPVYLRR